MDDELKVKVKVEVDDSSSTKSRFQKDVQKIADETKDNPAKITIGIDSKSTETQFKETIHKIISQPVEIKINAKVNTSIQDINKKIQEMLSKSEKYSDYYIGKTSNRHVSGSDDRTISLQLYNDEMKKAIALKYKYNSEENSIEFVSQEDITNTKQLLDLQDKLANSTEKLKLKQYDIFNGFDMKLQSLDSSYLSGAKKIVDTDKLDILNDKRTQINTKISDETLNGIVSDKSISDIKKMIAEYELLIKIQKDAQYAANKLATGTFDDSQSKALAGFERQAATLVKFKNISSEAKDEISGIRKAIKDADDAVSLKHATDQFAVLKDKVKTTESQIKSYNSLLEVQNSGKMYVPDRSKSNPTENIKQQLLGQADVSKVSISGKNYFDGQKEQLKSFSATVTLATGEVKKLNFELTDIGKRKGFVQTDNGTMKTVTDIKRNFKELMGLQDKVNAISIGGTLENDFIKSSAAIKSLRSDTTALNNELNAVKSGFDAQQRNINSLMNGRDVSQLDSGEIKQLNEYILKMNEAIKLKGQLDSKVITAKSVQSSNSGIHKDTMALKNLIAQMKDYQNINDRFQKNSGFSTRFSDILGQAESDDLSGNISNVAELTNKLKTLKNEIKGAGLEGQTFTSKLQAQMSKLGVYFSAAGLMMGAFNQVKNMIKDVVELDGAMTELKKVTDETDATYSKFLDNAESRAKKLGSTLTDTITATADFARLGFNLSDSEKIADAALVYKNVGDGIKDVSQASESIISTMKAFGFEASHTMEIVDRFNKVGNNFAISSKDVGEGLKRSASALSVAGNSVDQSIALLVAGNNVVQDVDVVATALKTSALRLTNTKGKLEELGEDADGAAESITKLQTQILNLTKGKVDIMLNEDTFKSTYDIMLGMSKIWDSMNQKDQMTALDLMFGKRGANVGSSIITNMSDAEKVLSDSINSSGSALAENEKVLNSIQGKLSQFTAQYEALSNSVVNSELIKGVVDSGTGLLGTLTAITGFLKPLPTLITVAAGAVSGLTNKGGLKIKSSKMYLRPFAADGNIGQDQYEYGVLCLGAA